MLEVTSGKVNKPRKIVLYGVAGIGKSTWAAGAPAPLFLQTEEGAENIGVDRLPMRRSLTEVQKDIRNILTEDHNYKTLVIDTGDGVEALTQTAVATSAGEDMIGAIAYGRGYDASVLEIKKILFMLDRIRDVRGMAIIILAHAKIARFEDPANEAYDRYSLQMHHKAAAEVMGWADEVLFANYKTFVRKTEQGFRERNVAVGTGERFLFTREMPAYYAKNRLDLPPEMPFPKVGGWQIYADYFAANAQEGAPAAADNQAASPAEAIPAGQGAPSTFTDDELLAAGFAPSRIGEMDFADMREAAKEMRNLMDTPEKSSVSVAIKNNDTARLRELLLRVEARQEGKTND